MLTFGGWICIADAVKRQPIVFKVVRGMTNVYCYLEHYPDDVEYWLDNRLNSASRAVTGTNAEPIAANLRLSN